MNKYYVYALLDPTKPGKYTYGELNFSFLYEPFYIGKGTGSRIKGHLVPSSLKNKNYKNSKIKALLKKGVNPIEHKIWENLYEDDALSTEIYFIKNIGRFNLKKGPLTNLTDGGDGTTNMILEKTRKKVDMINKDTLQVIKTFDSGVIAVVETGINSISFCCNGKGRTAGGYIWKFHDKELDLKNIENIKLTKIDVFNKKHKLIKTFDSIQQTSKELNIPVTDIGTACRSINILIRKNKYIFEYHDKELKIKYPKELIRKYTTKKIIVINVENDEKIIFESIINCSKTLKINPSVLSRTLTSNVQYSNYKIYYYDYYISKNFKEKRDKLKLNKPLEQYSLDGILIKIYDSVKQVKKFGYDPSNVSRCCNGISKTYKGCIWKFKNNL